MLQIVVTYKAEIMSVAEYLSTQYEEDPFVNIVDKPWKKPSMNSTITTAAKVVEFLNQSNVNRDKKKEGVEHTQARLGDSLKNKLESNIMYGQYIWSIDTELIVKKTHSFGCRGDNWN